MLKSLFIWTCEAVQISAQDAFRLTVFNLISAVRCEHSFYKIHKYHFFFNLQQFYMNFLRRKSHFHFKSWIKLGGWHIFMICEFGNLFYIFRPHKLKSLVARKPDRTSILIWIQTIWHSDNVLERIFWKLWNFEKSQQMTTRARSIVLILYVPVNNFSVMSGWVFPSWISTKLRKKCLAEGRITVTSPAVRLELATLLSPV